MSRPLVYLGRAIDGRAEPDFYGWAQRTESLLLAAGLESVDPVLLYSQAAETEVDPFDRVRSDPRISEASRRRLDRHLNSRMAVRRLHM